MNLFERVQNFWPKNMREATPATPDSGTPAPDAVVTNFQFPLIGSRLRSLGFIEVYLIAVFIFSFFGTQFVQGKLRLAQTFGDVAQNSLMASNITFAFVLMMVAELIRSRLDAVLVGLSALVVFLVTFTLCS